MTPFEGHPLDLNYFDLDENVEYLNEGNAEVLEYLLRCLQKHSRFPTIDVDVRQLRAVSQKLCNRREVVLIHIPPVAHPVQRHKKVRPNIA